MKLPRVYANGRSWYYVEDLAERNPRTGRPRQKWHHLCRIDAGEATLHQALAAFHGMPPARGDMPARLQEFRKDHFTTLSLGVRREYERMFVVIAEAFADFDAAEVEPGDVLNFLNSNFAEQRTARGHYKARLSTFFSWCVLNRAKTGVTVNPCREIRLRKPPKRKGLMSAEVYWKMRGALPESGQLFLELTYLTRQRPTEIRLLRESAIKPDRIRFEPTKTEDSSAEFVEVIRSARIDRILDRLRALRADRQKGRKVVPIGGDPYLMVSEDGEPFTKSGLNSVWRRARAAAGVGKVTTRDIRPYALSQMERDGATVEMIRQAAAHTTTSQTDGYLNQHRERFSRIVLKLPPRPR